VTSVSYEFKRDKSVDNEKITMIENLELCIREQNGFVYPNYEKYCISNLPSLILNMFNIKNTPKSPLEEITKNFDQQKVKNIVLFVIDGFGFNQFLSHYKENRFLSKLVDTENLYPLTSVFPSQTTNALTTLNTGLSTHEHGLFEYFIYINEIGKIVNTLRFESLEFKRQNKIVKQAVDPKSLFSGKSMHSTLKENGINTFTHMCISNANNSCSKVIFDGSTIIPAFKSSDLIVNLRKNLERSTEETYFFVHLDSLDTIAHEYGPLSYEYFTELSTICYLLNKEIVKKINPKTAQKTLLLLSADHGGVDVVPSETTYLNRFPKLIRNLQRGKGGQHILPVGSPREVFLHVKEEKLRETSELLSREIGKKAEIVETKEAVEGGLFGLGDVSNEFLERIGNLLILPYRNETVWFERSESSGLTYKGYHGGLDEKEMLVPLAVAKLDELK